MSHQLFSRTKTIHCSFHRRCINTTANHYEEHVRRMRVHVSTADKHVKSSARTFYRQLCSKAVIFRDTYEPGLILLLTRIVQSHRVLEMLMNGRVDVRPKIDAFSLNWECFALRSTPLRANYAFSIQSICRNR